MPEDQAFFLLRHLMFRRGLRKLYLPDMSALQLHLYQLSRLLHDRLPNIYNYFEKHDVSPTLYATPWFLTLFASQFPLGFVTRVFGKIYILTFNGNLCAIQFSKLYFLFNIFLCFFADLLFLESSEVLFRVSVALLEEHQDQLLTRTSFEGIMEYFKVKLYLSFHYLIKVLRTVENIYIIITFYF